MKLFPFTSRPEATDNGPCRDRGSEAHDRDWSPSFTQGMWHLANLGQTAPTISPHEVAKASERAFSPSARSADLLAFSRVSGVDARLFHGVEKPNDVGQVERLVKDARMLDGTARIPRR